MSQTGRCQRSPPMTRPSVTSVPGTCPESTAIPAPADAQGRRARTVPAVGRAVGAVVPGQVLLQEVAERLLDAGQRARAQQH